AAIHARAGPLEDRHALTADYLHALLIALRVEERLAAAQILGRKGAVAVRGEFIGLQVCAFQNLQRPAASHFCITCGVNLDHPNLLKFGPTLFVTRMNGDCSKKSVRTRYESRNILRTFSESFTNAAPIRRYDEK